MTILPPPKPTDAELEILQLLWQLGPSTVRSVFEVMSTRRTVGYTTVLKMLQIMTDKKLVERDVSQRSHIYTARMTQEQTQEQLIGHLAKRAFGGSSAQLVMHALSSEKASADELAQIRMLLDGLEES